MKIQVLLMNIAILWLIGIGQLNAQTRDANSGFFQQSFGDLSDELQTARDEGKKGVFVMFDDKDCPWCAKMKATVLNQVKVQSYRSFAFFNRDSTITAGYSHWKTIQTI